MQIKVTFLTLLRNHLIILGALLVIFILINPSIAYAIADNDDPLLEACDIKIGGISVVPESGVTVYPTTINGDLSTFLISVCTTDVFNQTIAPAQNASPAFCLSKGRTLVASMPGGWSSWHEIDLAQNAGGCFTGEIIMKKGDAWGPELDIELNSGDGVNSGCYSKMPVCKRVEPVFERSTTQDQGAKCKEAVSEFESCKFLSVTPNLIRVGDTISLSGKVPAINEQQCGEDALSTPSLSVFGPPNNDQIFHQNPDFGSQFNYSLPAEVYGEHRIVVSTQYSVGGQQLASHTCTKYYRVCPEDDASCTSNINGPLTPADSQFSLCGQASDTVKTSSGKTQQKECEACFAKNAIWTAVGCIETKPLSIIQAVVKIGVGIGGGIALVMTLVGGFLLTTSQGDPKRIQEGKEMITSSVIGILFVLFSVVILQFIGVTIFRIPGFGTS